MRPHLESSLISEAAFRKFTHKWGHKTVVLKFSLTVLSLRRGGLPPYLPCFRSFNDDEALWFDDEARGRLAFVEVRIEDFVFFGSVGMKWTVFKEIVTRLAHKHTPACRIAILRGYRCSAAHCRAVVNTGDTRSQ